MNSIISLLVLTLVACLHVGDAYKILAVFPLPGKSHTILGDGIVRHLANAGHEVTYITPIIKKSGWPSNVRQIDVSDNFNYLPKEMLDIKAVMDRTHKMDIRAIFSSMLDLHNKTYHNPNVKALLKDTSQNFDVVLVEWMFSEAYSFWVTGTVTTVALPCGFAATTYLTNSFGALFNAPFIWISTVEPHWMVTSLIDGPLNPAYNADIISSSVTPFSFFVRVKELGLQLFGLLANYFLIRGTETEVYNSLAPFFKARGQKMPVYQELKYNASLMLGNSHVSLGQPVSLPASYKNIGGYHIETKVAPLPEDLQKLLDNAKHGLIYFSMGSNLKSKDMPNELKVSLLKMFGTLKQTVLWKFEEVLPNLSSNVHIVSWAPQQSILSHPNCLLFITHGGLLSTTETVHFGKPIIGIPVFADQFINVNRAVKKGIAKKVDLSYTMADELKAAIEEVIQNPAYSKKVKELSFVYHHRLTPPGVELVHWVEHVVKTGGAPHLRSPALQVPFYQKLYLDLAAVILAVIFLIRAAFRRIFKKNLKKVKKN